MTFDQICVAMAGISFIGLSLQMRKQQNKNWKALLLGGSTMLVLVILSLIFEWSL